MTILAAAAGLPDEFSLYLHGIFDSFFIGNLRFADIRADFEFSHQSVCYDFKVKLFHSGDYRLASLLVEGNSEGGVFLGQLRPRYRQSLLVGLGLRLDGY